jgi:hypothetical protein
MILPSRALLLAGLAAAPLLSTAQSAAPFQISLWPPDWQLVAPERDVEGLRLQVYGRNADVTGLDIGLANETSGDFRGVAGVVFFVPTLYNRVDGSTTGWQVGVFNVTGGEVVGWQGGLVSLNNDDLHGLQTSFLNYNEPRSSDLRGVQLGVINVSGAVEGVQLGLVNYATSLRGVQVGLWNEVASRAYDEFDPMPRVFPFFNLGF